MDQLLGKNAGTVPNLPVLSRPDTWLVFPALLRCPLLCRLSPRSLLFLFLVSFFLLSCFFFFNPIFCFLIWNTFFLILLSFFYSVVFFIYNSFHFSVCNFVFQNLSFLHSNFFISAVGGGIFLQETNVTVMSQLLLENNKAEENGGELLQFSVRHFLLF